MHKTKSHHAEKAATRNSDPMSHGDAHTSHHRVQNAGNLAVQRAVTTTHGQPLDQTTQSLFEQHFDADLSEVRVHTDDESAQAALDIHAKAFTYGTHIYFGQGNYQPGTEAGNKLLAHELTHTLQQRNSLTVQSDSLISRRDDASEREAQSTANDFVRPSGANSQPVVRQRTTSVVQCDDDSPAGHSAKAGFGNRPHAVKDPGFGNEPHAVLSTVPNKPPAKQPGFGNQPHAVGKAGFGNQPRALPAGSPEPQADDKETLAEALLKTGFVPQPRDISWEPADNIEQFKKIWKTAGQDAFETYVHELLLRMRNTGSPDLMNQFVDRFFNYVWKQIDGPFPDDPNQQMLWGIASTVVLQQTKIEQEIEAEKKFVLSFEEEARKYTKEVLKKSQERVVGEFKHYFGGSWVRDFVNLGDDVDSRTLEDDRAARKGLGIAAAGLAKRRAVVIKANADYRNMVRTWGHYSPYSEMKPVEDAQAEASRVYEVFRMQVIPRFPILEEISSPEIHPFDNEYDEPDDSQGQQLNMLAKMAKDGNMSDGFKFIVNTITEKLRNISKVGEEIEPGGDINIWRVPELVQGTRERMGIAFNTVEAKLIDNKFAKENQPRNDSESILGTILLYGGLILAPFTEGLSLVPYGIYEAGKVGIAIAEHIEEYRTAKALHGTDFGAAAISAEDPSLFWLAGDILNAGLAVINLAPIAGPAARMFRKLAPFARLAREVRAGEEALITLKNTAREAAGQELKLGVEQATEFAESVVADARAARTGEALGMTADEARMLAEVEPAAAKAAARQVDVLAAQPAPMTVGEQTARVEELLAKQKTLKKQIEQANSNQITAGRTVDRWEGVKEAGGSLKPKQAEWLDEATKAYDKAREMETALRAELQTVESNLTNVRRQAVQPTTWQEHQSAVFQRQIADHPGASVGHEITLEVTDVATNTTVKIKIDVAVFESGELKLIDAKFSAQKDLTQGAIRSVYEANQSVVYPWISGGNKVIVVPRGANAANMGLKVGEAVKVSPKVEVHVNSPEGIRVRDFKDTL